MVADNSDFMLMNAVSVFQGTAGAVANNPLGFIASDANVNILWGKNSAAGHVQGRRLPKHFTSAIQNVTANIPLMSLTTEILGLMLGVTPVGLETSFGDPTTDVRLPVFSYAIVGTDAVGTTHRFDIPYGAAIEDTSMDRGQEIKTVMGLVIGATDPSANTARVFPKHTEGSGNLEATLATGVLTRTAGYHRIRSESVDTADILDSIGGSGLTDNEFLTLQLGKVTEPITFTHLNDTLELIEDANFVMDNMLDRMVVQYGLANTKWVEVERRDEP